MHLSKDTSRLVMGTIVLAAVLLFANIGRPDVTFVVTGGAVIAVLLTFIAITVNTYRNATPDRPMGRLIHDPDGVTVVTKMPPRR